MAADTNNKILKKLEEQKREDGSLPILLEFYQKLLQTQSEARKLIGTPAPGPDKETIHQRMQQGLPLIGPNELVIDGALARDAFVKVIAVFAGYPELFGKLPEKLGKPGAGRLLTGKTIKAWFSGKELPSTIRNGASENLMQTIIQATLQPFLASYAQTLISSVEQDCWHRGYCPICGGSPDLAFMEKEYGARWLLCSRCDSEWLFKRLECPYCGNQEQSTLAFFTDDEELYRLYVCEQCKRYLKVIDLRKTEAEILLPLERLNTIDIDSQAKEYGYSLNRKPAAQGK